MATKMSGAKIPFASPPNSGNGAEWLNRVLGTMAQQRQAPNSGIPADVFLSSFVPYLFPAGLSKLNPAQASDFVTANAANLSALLGALATALAPPACAQHPAQTVLLSALGVTGGSSEIQHHIASAAAEFIGAVLKMAHETFYDEGKPSRVVASILQQSKFLHSLFAPPTLSDLALSYQAASSAAAAAEGVEDERAAAAAAAALASCPALAKIFRHPTLKTDLRRFITAQDGKNHHTSLSTAMAEIAHGEKQSCWIWYVAPQLLDPGRSSANNSTYQLRDQTEIVAYILHPILGPRQTAFFNLVQKQLAKDIAPSRLMGMSVDAKKLHHSCSSFFFGCDSLLEEDRKRSGEISKAMGAERWRAVVVAMHQTITLIIAAIRKQPYGTEASLPEHDPVVFEKWQKSEPWIVV